MGPNGTDGVKERKEGSGPQKSIGFGYSSENYLFFGYRELRECRVYFVYETNLKIGNRMLLASEMLD